MRGPQSTENIKQVGPIVQGSWIMTPALCLTGSIDHPAFIKNILGSQLTQSSRSLLPLIPPLMSLFAILVLRFILISLSPITSPTSPAPALCTFVTSSASDPCFTLKLSPPPSVVSKIVIRHAKCDPGMIVSLIGSRLPRLIDRIICI